MFVWHMELGKDNLLDLGTLYRIFLVDLLICHIPSKVKVKELDSESMTFKVRHEGKRFPFTVRDAPIRSMFISSDH